MAIGLWQVEPMGFYPNIVRPAATLLFQASEYCGGGSLYHATQHACEASAVSWLRAMAPGD